ncbi:hypothetical protein KW508_08535 [Vibrio fluvialis]|nr:hypothetical protein [Vibrio fluvialis]
MLKKTCLASLVAIASVLPATASANNFNYNFLEVRTALSPESFGGEFSTFFTENSHFVGRADSRFEGDWDLAGGIGFNGPINQFADIYGQMLLHSIRGNGDEDHKTETNMEINIGTRIWLTSQIEGHARIGRNDDNSVFIAGLRFHSTQQMVLNAEVRNAGVWGPQISMGVRFQY